jgi:hypothetical protein
VPGLVLLGRLPRTRAPRPNADPSANAKTWLRRRAKTHRHDLLANPGVTGVSHRLVRARVEGGRSVSVLRFEMSREPGAAATGFDILHHHRRRRATRPASTLEAPGRGPVQAGSVNTSWAASCQTELAQTCVPASFSRADRRRQGGYEAPRPKASCGMLRISDRKPSPCMTSLDNRDAAALRAGVVEVDANC